MKIIKSSDWDRIRGYAVDIANASGVSDNNIIYERRRRAMLSFLNKLEVSYGERADLLATKADYVKNIWYRLRLLEKALELALVQRDRKNIAMIRKDINEMSRFPKDGQRQNSNCSTQRTSRVSRRRHSK